MIAQAEVAIEAAAVIHAKDTSLKTRIDCGVDYLADFQHNEIMELSDFALCPKCNAVMKTSECLNCGHNIVPKKEKPEKEVSQVDLTKPVEEKREVKSIFEQLVSPDYDLLRNEGETTNAMPTNKRSRTKYIVLGIIILLFVATFSFGAYDLFFKKIDFKKPGEISMENKDPTAEEIAANIKSLTATGIERTIELDTGLKEGNFEKLDFSVFASPETNMLIEMFDFKDFLKNIADKGSIYDQMKKDFSFSDDDFEVYFDKSFAIIFPENSFDKWGIILSSNDEKFITQKMETYKKLSADKKTIYPAYTVETKKIGDDIFILISNSKVFLDQMKESSEGVLPNLGKDALYVDALADMPKLGSVLIYKKPETRTWNYVTEWAVKMHPEYVGLEQTMLQLTSRFISIYSKDNKTRIVVSN